MKFLVKKGLVQAIALKPQIQNLVVTVDFGKNIDLEEFSKNSKVIYEPEQFPGAILKLNEPFKTSILVFASGKAVIAGLKSSVQIEPIIQYLKVLIEPNQT